MNCINCYHYEACASVDVTGFVTDREKENKEACEHFLNQEDVRPTAHWVRKVYRLPWSPNVRVDYECSRCNCTHERVYTQELIPKNVWDDYLHEHWMPGNEMYPFCHGCGAEMKLDETDHRNHLTKG